MEEFSSLRVDFIWRQAKVILRLSLMKCGREKPEQNKQTKLKKRVNGNINYVPWVITSHVSTQAPQFQHMHHSGEGSYWKTL